LRVPIAIGRFYEQCLWIPHNFLPTYPDLHHGLLGVYEPLLAKDPKRSCPEVFIWEVCP